MSAIFDTEFRSEGKLKVISENEPQELVTLEHKGEEFADTNIDLSNPQLKTITCGVLANIKESPEKEDVFLIYNKESKEPMDLSNPDTALENKKNNTKFPPQKIINMTQNLHSSCIFDFHAYNDGIVNKKVINGNPSNIEERTIPLPPFNKFT